SPSTTSFRSALACFRKPRAASSSARRPVSSTRRVASSTGPACAKSTPSRSRRSSRNLKSVISATLSFEIEAKNETLTREEIIKGVLLCLGYLAVTCVAIGVGSASCGGGDNAASSGMFTSVSNSSASSTGTGIGGAPPTCPGHTFTDQGQFRVFTIQPKQAQ